MKVYLIEPNDLEKLRQQIRAEVQAAIEEALNSKQQKEWYTEKEAREFLGVCKGTMSKYRREGVIPFSQRHRKIYYRLHDLTGYLTRNSTIKNFKKI